LPFLQVQNTVTAEQLQGLLDCYNARFQQEYKSQLEQGVDDPVTEAYENMLVHDRNTCIYEGKNITP
jgi:elongation factor P hydroxylase